MRHLVPILLLLAGCKAYPFAEIEHERSHEVEVRAGVTLVGKTTGHEVDVFGGRRFRLSDHVDDKVQGRDPIVGLRFRWGRK